MHDLSPKTAEYTIVHPDAFRKELAEAPLWYFEGPVRELLDKYYYNGPSDSAQMQRGRTEVVRLFTDALARREVYLGNQPGGFNDDDRWGPHNFGLEPTV